jgi:hypothetical protein
MKIASSTINFKHNKKREAVAIFIDIFILSSNLIFAFTKRKNQIKPKNQNMKQK